MSKLGAILLYLFLVLPSPVSFAFVEDFVITEIMYDPSGADGDKEWVEVFNNGATAVTIVAGSVANSLRFYDGGSNRTLATTAWQGSLTIDPQAYFILAESGAAFKSSHPSYGGTLIEIRAMRLGNTEETIGLRIGANGNLFAIINYSNGWGGSGNNRTLERKNISAASDQSNFAESSSDGGTPGVAYQTAAAVVYPTTVRMSEFLPDPESGGEWVELYNQSVAETATLNNWQLDDIDGGSSPQTFSATIGPLSYAVVYFSSNKLNNDGDSLRLVRPDGFLVDSFNYSSSKKGQSYVFDGQTVVPTARPTPGAANALASAKDKFAGSLADIKRLPVGHAVDLKAYVTVPENLLGKKDFYVSDGDTGIKISYSQSNDPGLKVGDEISLGSTLEESNQEKYVKTDVVMVLGKEARMIEPRRILTGEVAEPSEGMLVRVQGKVVESSGETFYLDDGSGRAKIFLRDSTGIIKIKMTQGDEVWVMGLVSQYGFLKNGDGNYRILPRFQGDLYNLTEGHLAEAKILGASNGSLKELPRTGSTESYIFGWILIFLGAKLKMNPRPPAGLGRV